jgi:plasmid maintenance system antidote protein VapI
MYKFRIKEYLNQLPVSAHKIAMKELPTILGVHRVQFSNIINTSIDSDYEPKAPVMIKLASYFGVRVDELYVNPPVIDYVQSISEELNISA